MNAYLNYIIEVNIGIVLFLGSYHLLLRQETHFRMLRMFMLAGIFTSLLFPLISFQNSEAASPLSMGQVVPAYWLPEMSIRPDAGDNFEKASFNFWTYATIVYAIGLILFFGAVLFQLSRLWHIIHHSKTYRMERLRIAESKEDRPTFSFFNFIFIGKAHALSTTEKQQIIQHEAVHARQWHSFDILLMNGLKIFFWFNPFINTYKKIFIQLHEFEADAHAVENSDVNKYCSLLARVALESADFKLANHFNSSLTVKRISMIRSPKKNIGYWKVAVCALLLPATFLLVSCQDQFGKGEGISTEIYSEIQPAAPQDGLEAFYNVIKKNITYPAESRASHKYGRVLVRFVVNENGSLSDMEILQSPDELLGKEALRMLTLSPEWAPGKKDGIPVKQHMVLPIVFKLDVPGEGVVVIPERENATSVPDGKSSVEEIAVETLLQSVVVVGYASK